MKEKGNTHITTHKEVIINEKRIPLNVIFSSFFNIKKVIIILPAKNMDKQVWKNASAKLRRPILLSIISELIDPISFDLNGKKKFSPHKIIECVISPVINNINSILAAVLYLFTIKYICKFSPILHTIATLLRYISVIYLNNTILLYFSQYFSLIISVLASD